MVHLAFWLLCPPPNTIPVCLGVRSTTQQGVARRAPITKITFTSILLCTRTRLFRYGRTFHCSGGYMVAVDVHWTRIRAKTLGRNSWRCTYQPIPRMNALLKPEHLPLPCVFPPMTIDRQYEDKTIQFYEGTTPPPSPRHATWSASVIISWTLYDTSHVRSPRVSRWQNELRVLHTELRHGPRPAFGLRKKTLEILPSVTQVLWITPCVQSIGAEGSGLFAVLRSRRRANNI